jgi:hypothetical protein
MKRPLNPLKLLHDASIMAYVMEGRISGTAVSHRRDTEFWRDAAIDSSRKAKQQDGMGEGKYDTL